MYIFDMLIVSVLLYGFEIFGWRNRNEIKVIQTKYIRWCLKLEKCTPDYSVLGEIQREMLRTKAGYRAMKFEQNVLKTEDRKCTKRLSLPRGKKVNENEDEKCTKEIAISK